MTRLLLTSAIALMLTACACGGPFGAAGCYPDEEAMRNAEAQDRYQSPSDTFRVVGDYAGRDLTLTVDGKVVYTGSRPFEPPGIMWQVKHDESLPAELMVDFEDCPDVAIVTIPVQDNEPMLVVRGCEVEF